MKKNNKKDKPVYYLTLFKIEGHETWRIGGTHDYPEGFDKYLKKQPGHPKITERIIYVIDRLTGDIIKQ